MLAAPHIPRVASSAPHVYALPSDVLQLPDAIPPGTGAQLHLWPDPAWVHLSQYKSPITQDAPETSVNCGPASALIAVRLLGLDLPGFHDEHSQTAIEEARRLTGRSTSQDMETKFLFPILAAAGAKGRVVTGLDTALSNVRKGRPTIIGGNALAPGSWSNPTGVDRGKVGHWVCVSGFDKSTQKYIVDDPEWVTPVSVTKKQLRNFFGPDDYWDAGVVVSRADGSGRFSSSTVLAPRLS